MCKGLPIGQKHGRDKAKLIKILRLRSGPLGKGPVLMIMGKNDLTAPIENGYRMKAEHGERLTLITIDDAGHAVGLEKPKR